MTKKIVEFYWDAGSTNTYFAYKLIKPIIEKHDATMILHPFNLGYVFRTHNYTLMEEPEIKLKSRKRDLQRWATKYDLPFVFPEEFPIKTSRILRGALAMRDWGLEQQYTEAVLDAYWEQGDASVQDYQRLGDIVRGLGIDEREFQDRSESDSIRRALMDSTNQGLDRGVFGVPSFFVGDELFWGKDRMEFIEDELIR